MPNAQSLTVVNDSGRPALDFAVFAVLPVEAACAPVIPVWVVRRIAPGNHCTFAWTMEWGLVWSASGVDGGIRWTAGGSLDADPGDGARAGATFDWDGDFSLTPKAVAADGAHLRVEATAAVPTFARQASAVGVALGGSPACLVATGPNLRQTFTLRPAYYVDAGRYAHGQAVDAETVAAFRELRYPAPNTALTAVLSEQNTWTVT